MLDEARPEDVSRCREGDIAGLEAIYRAYGDRVFRLCRGVLADEHAAEDATQEVFLRVFKKLGTFRGECRLSTWIYRLTVNHCLNVRKRWFRWPVTALDGLARDLADEFGDGRRTEARVAAREEVDRLLQSLPEPQRAVLALREILALEYKEIAGVLGIAEGTVMSRLSRARSALANAVRTSEIPSPSLSVGTREGLP